VHGGQVPGHLLGGWAQCRGHDRGRDHVLITTPDDWLASLTAWIYDRTLRGRPADFEFK
jgi:hypothetical protein